MIVGHQGRWYLAIWKAPVWITDYYSYLCSAGRAMDAATNIKQRYETNNKRTTPDIGVQSDKSALLRLRPLHLSLALPQPVRDYLCEERPRLLLCRRLHRAVCRRGCDIVRPQPASLYAEWRWISVRQSHATCSGDYRSVRGEFYAIFFRPLSAVSPDKAAAGGV